jgi:hypothetical protein
MKADRDLWLDDKGTLCDRPPTTGMKLAMKGAEINARLVRDHALHEEMGQVLQSGNHPKSPNSTPPPVVADRLLFITNKGELTDIRPNRGIKIADAGQRISSYYVCEYSLYAAKDGTVKQRSTSKPKTASQARTSGKGKKSVKTPANKSVKPDPDETKDSDGDDDDDEVKAGDRGSGGLFIDSDSE